MTYIMRSSIATRTLCGLLLGMGVLNCVFPAIVSAQTTTDANSPTSSILMTQPERNTLSYLILDKKDLTLTSNTPDQAAISQLLAKRRVEHPGIFTFFAWWVQDSILSGVSLNTI